MIKEIRIGTLVTIIILAIVSLLPALATIASAQQSYPITAPVTGNQIGVSGGTYDLVSYAKTMEKAVHDFKIVVQRSRDTWKDNSRKAETDRYSAQEVASVVTNARDRTESMTNTYRFYVAALDNLKIQINGANLSDKDLQNVKASIANSDADIVKIGETLDERQRIIQNVERIAGKGGT